MEIQEFRIRRISCVCAHRTRLDAYDYDQEASDTILHCVAKIFHGKLYGENQRILSVSTCLCVVFFSLSLFYFFALHLQGFSHSLSIPPSSDINFLFFDSCGGCVHSGLRVRRSIFYFRLAEAKWATQQTAKLLEHWYWSARYIPKRIATICSTLEYTSMHVHTANTYRNNKTHYNRKFFCWLSLKVFRSCSFLPGRFFGFWLVVIFCHLTKA